MSPVTRFDIMMLALFLCACTSIIWWVLKDIHDEIKKFREKDKEKDEP